MRPLSVLQDGFPGPMQKGAVNEKAIRVAVKGSSGDPPRLSTVGPYHVVEVSTCLVITSVQSEDAAGSECFWTIFYCI